MTGKIGKCFKVINSYNYSPPGETWWQYLRVIGAEEGESGLLKIVTYERDFKNCIIIRLNQIRERVLEDESKPHVLKQISEKEFQLEWEKMQETFAYIKNAT